MRTVLLALLFCTVVAAHAEQFTAKVIVAIDGDTVMAVRDSGPPFKIRLAGIDAPEKEQKGGMASTESLSELALHKQVTVNSLATDSYGRLVAQLSADGNSINEEQVRRGMAWGYSNFHRDRAMKELQSEAKRARRGLWAENDPIPPWVWRKQHPGEKIRN